MACFSSWSRWFLWFISCQLNYKAVTLTVIVTINLVGNVWIKKIKSWKGRLAIRILWEHSVGINKLPSKMWSVLDVVSDNRHCCLKNGLHVYKYTKPALLSLLNKMHPKFECTNTFTRNTQKQALHANQHAKVHTLHAKTWIAWHLHLMHLCTTQKN